MLELRVHDEIKSLFPDIRIGMLSGQVVNASGHPGLHREIESLSETLRQEHDFESIRNIPAIQSAKKAYRHLGKDPNRYRLSAEAMMRRIVKGQSLYQINTVVDALNLVSLQTGVTIGGFDLDAVEGDIWLTTGKPDDTFDAIGRGLINIDRLPVYRDAHGPIGSPTSDCTRTMLTMETSRFMMIVTDFYGEGFIPPTMENLKIVLEKYAQGKEMEQCIV